MTKRNIPEGQRILNRIVKILRDRELENFPFELHFEVLNFSGWVYLGNNPPLLADYRLQCGALILSSLLDREELRNRYPQHTSDEIAKRFLPNDLVAKALFRKDEIFRSFEDFESESCYDTIAWAIGKFFCRAAATPQLKIKPSINRAIHFARNYEFREDKVPPSASNLRAQWSEHAEIVPFYISEYDNPRVLIATWTPQAMERIETLIQTPNHLDEFLTSSKYAQQSIDKYMEDHSLFRRFLTIPIPSTALFNESFPPFNPAEIAVLNQYKVR